MRMNAEFRQAGYVTATSILLTALFCVLTGSGAIGGGLFVVGLAVFAGIAWAPATDTRRRNGPRGMARS